MSFILRKKYIQILALCLACLLISSCSYSKGKCGCKASSCPMAKSASSCGKSAMDKGKGCTRNQKNQGCQYSKGSAKPACQGKML